METPLIKLINRSTLITFPSALEDFEIIGQNDRTKEVSFSHFVLLDIPEITASSNKLNTIDFKRIESVALDGENVGVGSIGDRLDISESLQNYLMNFDSILTEQEWYKKDMLKNSTERIFWKWMREIGAMRFTPSDESTSKVNGMFVEEYDNTNILKPSYKRVVKYIGAIGLQNQVKGRKNSFKEIYLMIPSDSGNTPVVLFESKSDTNYYPQMIVGGKNEFINGFNSNSALPPTGLDLMAQYDRDVIGGLGYVSTDINLSPRSNWFGYNVSQNSYCTDNVFGDAGNDIITRTNLDSTTFSWYRNRLDGVGINFDMKNYADSTVGVDTFENYNKTSNAKSFKFNAVMLYYKVKDVNTGEEATNLYGVAFLGDIEEYSAGSSRIIRSTKIKNDSLVGATGNAFGFRFNFKISARQESITPNIEVDFNEETNFGMSLFSSFMAKSGEILKNYEDTIEANVALLEKNRFLMEYINSLNTVELENKYKALLNLLQENTINDANGELIYKLNTKIEEIIKGKTSVKIDLVLDVVGKDGIKVDYTKDKATMIITDGRQNYNSVEQIKVDISAGNLNEMKIGKSSKLIVVSSDVPFNAPISIALDDSSGWVSGQSLDICMSSMSTGQASLIIKTDITGTVSTSKYGLTIFVGSISQKNNIKLVCVNSKTLEFVIL